MPNNLNYIQLISPGGRKILCGEASPPSPSLVTDLVGTPFPHQT